MNDDMPDVVLPDEVCNALREAELDGVVDGVLTLEVWRRLSAADQAALVAHLPVKATSDADIERVLSEEVFAHSNRFFGTPSTRFWQALEADSFSADAVAAAGLAEAQRQSDPIPLARYPLKLRILIPLKTEHHFTI